MNERVTMSAPIGRFWRLGLLAKDLAEARLRPPGAHADRARNRLVDRLGHLHGLPQKMAQLMALAELGGPSAYAPLTGSQSPLPADEAVALIEQSLGRERARCFRSIDPAGIAASLGQVHRAVLADGRVVAVKVRYPDAEVNAEADLRALNGLTLPFGGLRRGFDLAAYRRAVGDMLRQELDYRREAESLRRFSERTAGCHWIAVPEVIDELSTDHVLTMTWLDGEPLEAACRWPEDERRQAAVALLRLFVSGCFSWRLLHADPHPGNYRFQRTEGGVRVVLFDFGCVQSLDGPRVAALAGLVEAARRGSAADSECVLAGYEALEFNVDLLAPMAHLLPTLNAILFEPFVSEGLFRASSWRLGERVERLLGPYRWNFRFAGPAELIFLVRAYLGLLRQQRALDVALDWSAVWRAAFAAEPPPAGPGPRASDPADERVVLSRHLRVGVWERGRPLLNVTFKAVLAERLPDIVPPEIEDNLRARQLDVGRIATEAAERQFAPGELFRLTEGDKLFRVWLE